MINMAWNRAIDGDVHALNILPVLLSRLNDLFIAYIHGGGYES